MRLPGADDVRPADLKQKLAPRKSSLRAAFDALPTTAVKLSLKSDQPRPSRHSKHFSRCSLVTNGARTPALAREELARWRQQRLRGLADADIVGLVFEKLLPVVLAQFVRLKEYARVFDAAMIVKTILMTWGDTVSDIVVAVQHTA